MKVELIKVHQVWNTLYPGEFNVGDVVELSGHTVTTKSGQKFSADEMCKSYSNKCSYSDIFKKVK